MKIKYLKTENATISIEYSKKNINNLIKELPSLEQINLERINIICSTTNLQELSNILDKITTCNIPIFLKVNNYNNSYEEIILNLNKKFYIVITTTIKEFNKYNYIEEIFYEINTNYLESKELLSITDKYTNIIINTQTKPLSKLKDINNSLSYINTHTTSKYLYFENLFIDKNLIYKCPYNIYLNNKNSQRKYGNNIPRNIYIDKKDNVYAIRIKNEKIIIGNYKESSIIEILKKCKKTTGYKNFIKYNKILFFELLDQCPYNTIDYISFLEEVINYDK